MTNVEKEEKLQELRERMLALRAEMQKTDGKASKCAKFGLVFADVYPEEYAQYTSANKEYNEVEVEYKQVLAQSVEEEDSNKEKLTE